MTYSTARQFVAVMCSALFVGATGSVQAQTCPTISQATATISCHNCTNDGATLTDWGMLSTQNVDAVNVNVEVVDGGTEETNFTAAQVQTVRDEITDIADNVSNMDSTTTNTDTATPQPTTPSAIAKAIASPTVVIQIASQATITASCGTGPGGALYQGCTNWRANAQGQTYYATTYVLASAVASTGWADLAIHELAISTLGEKDCDTGGDCSNSVASVPNSNATLTSCDKTRIKNVCTKCTQNN